MIGYNNINVNYSKNIMIKLQLYVILYIKIIVEINVWGCYYIFGDY